MDPVPIDSFQRTVEATTIGFVILVIVAILAVSTVLLFHQPEN